MTRTARLYLGDVPIVAEYDQSPGERQTFDHPGSPESVSIISVRIGEHVVNDVEIHFTEWQLEAWELQILEGLDDQRQDARDAADEAAHERQRDEAFA